MGMFSWCSRVIPPNTSHVRCLIGGKVFDSTRSVWSWEGPRNDYPAGRDIHGMGYSGSSTWEELHKTRGGMFVRVMRGPGKPYAHSVTQETVATILWKAGESREEFDLAGLPYPEDA